MTLSRRSTIKTIGVVGAGSAFTGTALAVDEHQDDDGGSDETPAEDELGSIRVGHFVPDAPNVDVYVDDQLILSDVAFGDLSPYLDIEPGTYTVSIAPAGEEEPVHQQTVPVETGYYTAAAIGELEGGTGDGAETTDPTGEVDTGGEGNESSGNATGNETATAAAIQEGEGDEAGSDGESGTGSLEFLVLADRRPEDIEQEGTTPVRLVHAAPDVPTVDVADAENGMTIFEDVEFGQPSGYVPMDPDLEGLALFPADDGDGSDGGDGNETDGGDGLGEDEVISQEDPVAVINFDLESDQVYTAYLIGYLGGEEGIEVEAEPAAAGDGQEAAAEGDDSSFRVRLGLDGTTDGAAADDESDATDGDGAVDGSDGDDREDVTFDYGDDDGNESNESHTHDGDRAAADD